MEELMGRFIGKLQEQLQTKVYRELLSNEVYQISVDSNIFQIYVYPHHILERLDSEKDIKTIHLDQDTLIHDVDKVIARLKVIAGLGTRIHARSTVAARIDKKIALTFQKEHHLHIALPGKYRYGLYHEGELVSIAVFSGGRKMNDKPDNYRSFELLRFCHKRDIITIGGISKLIRAFCKDFKPGDIMTYVDRDWAQDSALEKIGFQPIKITEPQTVIIKSGERINHQNLEEDLQTLPDTYRKRNNGSVKMVFPIHIPD